MFSILIAQCFMKQYELVSRYRGAIYDLDAEKEIEAAMAAYDDYKDEFLNHIAAPKKEIVWFENSAHELLEEEPQRFNREMVRVVTHGLN